MSLLSWTSAQLEFLLTLSSLHSAFCLIFLFLLGNQDHIKVELEKLKKTHDEQQQKLEERV
ncbi:hypothetical protein DV515_00016456 [Chloebia gouldiae]|uniref:Uncharacterized protein n=1 Tax=Chloebia gouldiae TaxID=44316 RepID=A0A3L8RSU4_CHLGU|nr:hypothetical protein DV515_00016456 [Chloebia gouldiae]